MIGQDKILHFMFSFIIALVLGLSTSSPILGFMGSLGIGGAKEIYDMISPTGFAEFGDLIANSIGAGIATILCYLALKVNSEAK